MATEADYKRAGHLSLNVISPILNRYLLNEYDGDIEDIAGEVAWAVVDSEKNNDDLDRF